MTDLRRRSCHVRLGGIGHLQNKHDVPDGNVCLTENLFDRIDRPAQDTDTIQRIGIRHYAMSKTSQRLRGPSVRRFVVELTG